MTDEHEYGDPLLESTRQRRETQRRQQQQPQLVQQILTPPPVCASVSAALSASSLTPTSEFTCLLDYYAGRRAYRYLLHACSTTLTTAPAHPEARFYRAFALSCEQSASEAIRELEQMVRENNGNGDYTLAATAAIIAAYRGGRGRVEKEGLERWKEQLKSLSKTSDVPSLLIAGRYFLHARKDKQAKQCLEKLLSRQPAHAQAATYLAMLQARSGNSRWIKKAANTVESLLSALASGSEQRVDINAALLACLILADRRDWQRAVQHLNSVIVAYPNFSPALVEKSSLLFLQREYEESLVLSYRVVQRDNQHVFALFAIVLYFLVKEGAGSVSAKERLSDLQAALDKCEPANDFLYAHWATIIARLTHRNKPILQMTVQMLQQVSKQKAAAGAASASSSSSASASSSAVSSPSAPLLIEQAYQYFLMDDLGTASSLYQQASKLEDSSEDGAGGGAGGRDGEGGKAAGGGGSAHMQALIGLIRIKLRSGRWKEANEELDFLSDLTGSQVLSNAADEERKEREGDASRLEVGLLRATLAYHWERDVAKASALLLDWAAYHRKLQQLAGGVDWDDAYNHHYDLLLALQPHLIIEVVQLALYLLPSEPAQHGDPPSPLLSSCLSLLSLLLAVIPGHLHAQILQAKLLYLAADFAAASASVSTALALDATNASAHLLCSYLALHAEDYKQSSAELEQARSYDFDIRNTAHYHVLKARLLVASGQLDDAAKVLLAAMELPGVKKGEAQTAATTGSGAGKRQSGKGLGDSAASSAASSVGRAAFPLTDDDRLSVFLELAGVYSALSQLPEASRTMAEAQAAFSSSSSSSSAATRLLMAEVDLHCKRKEFDSALALLRTVDADSRFYTRAKVRMADIFLHHKKSRAAFIAAFVDLCTVAPSLHNLGLLAEAHMAVQEPEAAIATYERALEAISSREREQEDSLSSSASDSGDDGSLTVSAIYSRIGQAMIATHDYRRAVEYYEEAVRGEEERDRQREERGLRPHPHVCLLLQDLAALYHRIKKYDDAAATVAKALEASKAKRSTTASTQGQSDTYGVDDVPLLQLDVKSWTLLSAVHRANNADEALLAALNTAFSLQTQLLSLLPSSSPQLAAEREVSSSLSHQLASYYQMHQANHEQAALHYQEALKTSPSSIPSLLALSQLHFALNEYDAAQQTLLSLLRIQPEHAEASLLLAELMYEKSEYDAAIYHFTQLLDREQGRYEALSKMISCLRRSGRLQDAHKYIAICEKAVTGAADSSSGSKAKAAAAEGKGADAAAGGKRRAGSDEDIVHYPTAPGLHFCKGLLAYYTNTPRAALVHLNYSRKDHDWGRQSLYHMTDIYLNPDHLDLFIEATEVKAEGGASGGREQSSSNLQAAERLLAELSSLGEKGWKYDTLVAYTLLASKQKAKQEKAIVLCTSILSHDAGYVPALLCLANAYHLLGQPAKTRNYLKRISKLRLHHAYLLEFEQSYLLLAELYLEIGKHELSTELCKRVLQLNKSCGKAWEVLGGIMEKEAAYRDASDNYEQAWYVSGQSHVNIGFKLAFNYLKCRKFVQAIDVCHAVLKLNPDMPKLRKEVLDKARQGLRP